MAEKLLTVTEEKERKENYDDDKIEFSGYMYVPSSSACHYENIQKNKRHLKIPPNLNSIAY